MKFGRQSVRRPSRAARQNSPRPRKASLTLETLEARCLMAADPYSVIDPYYLGYNPAGDLHVHSAADVAPVRNEALNYLWKGAGLPTRLPDAVSLGVAPPIAISDNLLRVDLLTINMANGFTSYAYVFRPVVSNNQLVIAHQGHIDGLEVIGMGDAIRALVHAGDTVLALQMPGYGPNPSPVGTDYSRLAAYDSASFTPMSLFLDPVAVSLNYLLPGPFGNRVAMFGISGGGWESTIYPALDPRITASFPMAGSYPLYLRGGPLAEGSAGTWEQRDGHGPFYTNGISYEDLYVLATSGGRTQVQMLNRTDPACFPGIIWQTYAPLVEQTAAAVGGSFAVYQYVAPEHEINDQARNEMLQLLGEQVQTSDDGDAGCTIAGGWATATGQGYDNAVHYAPSGGGSTASWQFGGLAPGSYEVAVTWTAYSNRATNAPYTVSDGSTPLGTFAVNQQLAPADFADGGAGWKNLGTFTVTSGSLVVGLSNAADGYVIADAVRVEPIGVPSVPAAQLLDGPTPLADGGGDALAVTPQGTPLTRVFTVRNFGGQPLTLSGPVGLPAGYALAAGFGTTTLAPGAFTTFAVRLTAAAAGSYGGTVSFATNDPANPTYSFALSGAVTAPPPPVIADDGDAGFATSGSWTAFSGTGYNGAVHFAPPGAGEMTATWTFSVVPGQYLVSVTWPPYPNRATNAPYTVFDGNTPRGTVALNQQAWPADLYDQDAGWANLGVFKVSGTKLVVQLSNAANGYVIADAVRIQLAGALSAPVAQVLDGTAVLASGTGSDSFGSTALSSPVTRTFTVQNAGTTTLALSDPITLPAGFALVSDFGTTTLAPGASTTFAVKLTAAAAGSYRGTLSFGTSDPNANPYTFTVTGTVGAPLAQVFDGTAVITSGTGSDAFGSTALAAPVTKTFTVKNAGSTTLTLLDPITLPAGFALASDFGATTLAPGASTTFSVRLTAAAAGSYGGTLSFGTSDPNANPYTFTVTGTVTAPVTQVFDGTTIIVSGTGSDAFGSTVLGTPLVKTFTVKNAGTAPLTLSDPITLPAGFALASDFGSTSLAPGASTAFAVKLTAATAGSYGGALSFGTSDPANNPYIFTITGTVTPPVTAPVAKVFDGANLIVSGTGSDSFGTTATGLPVTKTFTVKNIGTAPLALSDPIALPAGFSLVSDFGGTSLAPGASTTFSVTLTAAAAGSYGGKLSFGTNDPSNSPYTFTVSGTVSAVQIADDGGSAFTTAGSWAVAPGGGFNNGVHVAAAGNGSGTASWSFHVITGDRYRISVTWYASATWATNAPFTALAGGKALATALVNQRLAPADFTDAGVGWKDVGTFRITGSTLTVRLTNAANGPVVADAVRVQDLGPAPASYAPANQTALAIALTGLCTSHKKWSG